VGECERVCQLAHFVRQAATFSGMVGGLSRKLLCERRLYRICPGGA
jgi:hypothetical protein